jgi:polyisoprenoid-binding protein YceI
MKNMSANRDSSAWRVKILSILLLVICVETDYSPAQAAAHWNVDGVESQLNFSGTQGGAPFRGAFVRFTADVRFDPADLAQSQFDVVIDTSSAKTGELERDMAIRSDDLLAADRWPTARYIAKTFESAGDGKFTAKGQLSLRGVTRDIPLEFAYTKDSNGAWLKGKAQIDRLDFGVGQGEFASDAFVGKTISVQFSLKLKENPA